MKLTDRQVAIIKRVYQDRERGKALLGCTRDLAKIYGVDISTISCVVHRRPWVKAYGSLEENGEEWI